MPSRRVWLSRISQVIIVLTGTFCVYLFISFWGEVWTNYQFTQRLQTLEQENRKLAGENNHLVAQVAYLRTNAAVEKLAREKLNYIFPGDQALVIIQDPNTSPAPADATPLKVQTAPHPPDISRVSFYMGYWKDWWNVFFGPRSR